MKSGFAIGIDIGGTNTDMGIVNPNGECIKRMNIPTQSFTKVEDYADEIANVIRKMLLSNNITNIDGIFLGLMLLIAMKKSPPVLIAEKIVLTFADGRELGIYNFNQRLILNLKIYFY